MKALKIVGAIILVLVLGIVGIALIAPTHTHVERSAMVDAPMDFVWDHTNTLAGMHDWSPWVELDPDQETSIEGEDGTVGAIYAWSGDENVGKGTQEIIEISEGMLKTKLHFIEPYEGDAEAMVSVETTDDGMSKVTWAFDSDSPFPMNAMNLFMDMDEMLGSDFQKGMDNLKALVEEKKADRNEFNGITIEKTEMSSRAYIGNRSTIGFDEMEAFFGENFGKAYEAAAGAELEMMGMPSALYFMWDEENMQADLIAGIPVPSGSAIEGFESTEVGGEMLMVEHKGPYEGMKAAHEAIEAYMQWHGMEFKAPVIEEYVTDPMTEEDPNNWITRIYYPI